MGGNQRKKERIEITNIEVYLSSPLLPGDKMKLQLSHRRWLWGIRLWEVPGEPSYFAGRVVKGLKGSCFRKSGMKTGESREPMARKKLFCVQRE